MSSSAVSYANQNQQRFLSELKDLLRIPSISTLPQHKDDVRRAAQFIGYLGDEPAFAFVAEGNAHVGDELAGEREQGHGCESRATEAVRADGKTPVAAK